MGITTSPIALEAGEGEALWFLGALGTIKGSGAATGGTTMVSEWWAPRDHGSPLHVHHREHEWFYVLSGEVTFWIDGLVTVAGPGAFVFGPLGVPHTFIVTSDEARFLLVTQPTGFEDFVRAVAEPATQPVLPPATVAPPPPDVLGSVAADHGIEILGPPGIPD